MSDKPEALRLADAMTHYFDERGPDAEEVAAELRRLHSELERKSDAIQRLWKERDELRALNAELVEALRRLIDMDVAYRRGPVVEEAVEKARAALAKMGASK